MEEARDDKASVDMAAEAEEKEEAKTEEAKTEDKKQEEAKQETKEESKPVTKKLERKNIPEYEGRIEAVLFSVGEAVDREQLATALELDVNTTVKLVHDMMDKYDEVSRGIRIVEIENSFQMCTKADYYDTLVKVINVPKKHVLTDVLLETLSIIAYKQPITRQEIEAIRGVSCAHTVNKLVEYNLVQEVGRLEAIGRPILFGTTDEFLRCFGVQSTDELPLITPEKIEDFKQQAIEEAQLSFPPVKD